MTFTCIVNGEHAARNQGFRFDTSVNPQFDEKYWEELRHFNGERFVDNKLDSLYDFDGGLYQGDDGKYYAVEYVNGKPLCWQQLAKKEQV